MPTLTEPGLSAHADAVFSEEFAGTAHLSVRGENVPLFAKVLGLDEATEPAEGTFALDRPLQALSEGRIVGSRRVGQGSQNQGNEGPVKTGHNVAEDRRAPRRQVRSLRERAAAAGSRTPAPPPYRAGHPVAKPAEWLLTAVLTLIIVPAIAAIVGCVIAARPYKAERRHGYTTWPTRRQIDRSS